MATTTPVVRYKRVDADGTLWIKRYEVHIDDQVIGTVGTKMVSHAHGRVGRVVGHYTRSPRWFAEDAEGRGVRRWHDTRKGAMRYLVADWAAVNPNVFGDTVLFNLMEARDYRKDELRALEIAEINKLDDPDKD